ncbi:uncharacterized protein LOC143620978 [Bidens hawaiensis]|uniref:uncharacterized protein LOC143620978 n=1 Tax=Bidens hawaiensis TaxID=980011 RepID=UPI00404AF47A
MTTAKEMWAKLKTRHMGADRVREARLQTLTQELDNMRMKETENIDEYSNRLFGIASRSASLVNLKEVGYEDVVGRLKACEERIGNEELHADGRLMFGRSDSYNNRKGDNVWGRGRGSYGNRGRGRGRLGSQDRERANNEAGSSSGTFKPKKDRSNVQCYRCGQLGHFTSMCPDRKPPKQQESNVAETGKADGVVYMHEMVHLNEERLRPDRYENDTKIEDVWYLDNGASNHMTGNREFFSELNERITGKVRFGNGSCVEIKGKGSILFQEKSGERRLMTKIYYIPELKSNIISLGQATDSGCDVQMKNEFLTMHDTEGHC